jgi:hypothetical protein
VHQHHNKRQPIGPGCQCLDQVSLQQVIIASRTPLADRPALLEHQEPMILAGGQADISNQQKCSCCCPPYPVVLIQYSTSQAAVTIKEKPHPSQY